MKKRSFLILSIILAIIFALNCTIVSRVTAQEKQIKPIEILHDPVLRSNLGYDILISCDINSVNTITKIELRYRDESTYPWNFDFIAMEKTFENTYFALIPKEAVSNEAIYYHIYAEDNLGNNITYPGNYDPYNEMEIKPIKITITTFVPEIPQVAIFIGIGVVVAIATLYALDILKIPIKWSEKK